MGMVPRSAGKRVDRNSKWFKKAMRLSRDILFAAYIILMTGLICITAQSRFTGREPALLGYRMYFVDSGSMSPAIRQDSMIIVKELEPQDVKEKDIVTYYGRNESTRITHRIVKVIDNGKSFITRGDANNTDDPMPLDGDRLIGKVVFIIPLIGRLFRFLSTVKGMVTVVMLGVVWLAVPKLLAYKEE